MLGQRAIHHLALKVVDLQACAHFYRNVLGLPHLQTHRDAQGAERSVWLQLANDTILMLERVPGPPPAEASVCGWHLLALTITPKERDPLERRLQLEGITITSRTDYTLYIADPEGNRLGLSHYPAR